MNDTMLALMRLGQKGYYCSQIVMALALETRGEENPGLIRAMSGLAFGCGSGTGSCGALTGACAVLGLYAGKGDDTEEESEHLLMMTQELTDWFTEKMGALTCNDLVGEAGPEASRVKCGGLVADAFEQTMQILTVHGFDLSGY